MFQVKQVTRMLSPTIPHVFIGPGSVQMVFDSYQRQHRLIMSMSLATGVLRLGLEIVGPGALEEISMSDQLVQDKPSCGVARAKPVAGSIHLALLFGFVASDSKCRQ
jgi:hypothetical protein